MIILRFFKNQYFWLSLVLLLTFILRLYKIDYPIADWHSWRQADTAAASRNFIKEGFNPFLPKFDDMSAISQPPVANVSRLRFVEFPVYNTAVYPFYLFFGIDEQYSRLVSVLFSLGSIVFLYLICKRYLGTPVSLFVAFVYSLLPFNIFFSRTTLPEPTFLFFSLGMMYFVDKWIWEDKHKWLIWGFIFTATAFLIKPWAIFFTPPLIYSVFKKFGVTFKLPKRFIIFTLFSLLPFLLWRFWILQQPQGIPASDWLYNGNDIRFRPSFWWWMISERIGGEILGATGLVLFTIGFLAKPRQSNYFMHVWLFSFFAYFVIFATGNVTHNYYQYIFVPIAAIFLSLGFLKLVSGISTFLPRIWSAPLALLFLSLAFYFSWREVRGFYQINNYVIVEAGQAADQILPKEAVVLAPYNGDTAFLYQTNRSGWAIAALPIPELVADYGVTHFVSTTRDDKTNWVLRHFEILEDNPKFIIADLTKIRVPTTEEDPEP